LLDISNPTAAVKELRRGVLPWLWQLPPTHALDGLAEMQRGANARRVFRL